jgi:hypothetical protein
LSDRKRWRPRQPSAVHKPARPQLDPERRASVIAQERFSMAALLEASPEKFPPDAGPQTERIIDALFLGNPLLCVAQTRWNAATRPRETWRGHLARLPYMVPNPMRAKIGINQDGERSERCLDNVGPRRYLVIDQDQGYGTEDEQAAVIRYLAKCLRLVLVVHSGGKSLHAWFTVAGLTEQRVDQFMNLASRLGADNALRCPCQLARIPDGTRENGTRQRILFFNPAALPSDIKARQERPPVAAPEARGRVSNCT